MDMTKDNYAISKATLSLVLEALSAHWFSSEGEYNNDDVIAADQALQAEIQAQEAPPAIKVPSE
jgi:hypothetical protein